MSIPRRSYTTCERVLVALALVCCVPAVAAADWEELVRMPWGEGPGQVGLTPEAEDELQQGPHGIAVSGAGDVAVVDRVNGRALIFTAESELKREIVLPGMPGAAALLSDGRLAVTDELRKRLVRVLGPGGGQLRTPGWTLPPNRLVTVQDTHGGEKVEGLNGFLLRLPLSERTQEPGELERGMPSPDGLSSVVAFRRDGDLVVEFAERDVVLGADIWPAGGADGFGPGAVTVLATDGATAQLVLESVTTGDGPIEVRRAVVTVAEDGAHGARLNLPPPGPVVIPADLVATADGVALLLQTDASGCRLLRGLVPEVQR